jgi:RING finger protein 170
MFSLSGLEMWHRIRLGFMFIVAFLYFLSPLDIIPEALFGIFGFLDDILIVFLFAIYISIIYRQIIANRN